MSNRIDAVRSVAALFQATHLGKLPAASEMLPVGDRGEKLRFKK
ncbi:MAG: hypothetical protein V7K92_07030 [Nostoc sp.]